MTKTKQTPVRLYTTSYCGYCFRAKRLLAERQISYQEIDVTNDEDARSWLAEATGRFTVPQIFIGDEPIGGYTELAALDRRGELLERVQAA